MPFSDFHGNADAVHTVREMLAHDRFPHAVILAGPQGSGKYTLAQMIAKTMNCLERPTDRRPARFLRTLRQLHAHRRGRQSG